jgi:hypothetical protein
MFMSDTSVHVSNKIQGSKQVQLLVAGILVSTLLSACGGGGGPSAEETAARAAVTTAQSAATAAASAAQAAASAAQAEDETAAAKAAADATAAAKAAAQAAAQAAEKAAIDKSATDEADQAKSAAAAAQASADKAAALAVAAAQAAVDKAATMATVREEIDTAVTKINSEVQAAQSARASAGYAALQAEQQAGSYPEIAEAVSQAKTYAAQAATEAEKAVAEKTRVTQIKLDADNAQSVTALQTLASQAKEAQQAAETARKAAEQALQSTRTAAQQVADAVKIAEAARRYTKLDEMGNELSATASSWACLKDKQTGSVWEIKTNDGGLRDKDWRYRHLHNSGGYAGTRDYNGKTLCQGLGSCDPYSYINAVNSQSLCGRTSWRLPQKSELGSIAKINAGGQPPHIDQTFFHDVIYKPYEAAYCTENMIRNPAECGYEPGSAVHYNADGRIECNYQGVDFGLPLLNGIQTKENLELSILVPLRYYGEVKDGKPLWPNANWLCSTRLVSSR